MSFNVTLTKRVRRRKSSLGLTIVNERYVLNFKDPASGGRRQEFFERHKEAQARKNELITKIQTGVYVDERTVPTVAEAADLWLADKERNVKANTLAGYKIVVAHIRGQKADCRARGPVSAAIGSIKVSDLTTADIRAWHRRVAEQSGAYTANRAKSHLKSILPRRTLASAHALSLPDSESLA